MQSLKSNINYTYIHILYIYPHSQAYYQSPLKNSKCAPVPYASFFPKLTLLDKPVKHLSECTTLITGLGVQRKTEQHDPLKVDKALPKNTASQPK